MQVAGCTLLGENWNRLGGPWGLKGPFKLGRSVSNQKITDVQNFLNGNKFQIVETK